METEPATSSTPAASAAPAAASSSQQTPAAAASMPPAVNVNSTGTPGTATPAKADAGPTKWTDSFDPDLKEYVSQKQFQDPKSVLESYRNLEKLHGVPRERLLKIPESADDKAWEEIHTKLGKPATPEGYGFKPKDPQDPSFTNWASSTFHKLNLSATQGQALVKEFNDMQAGIQAEEAAKYQATVQEQTGKLKKEWGAAFNQNVNRARQAYRQFGIPDAAVDSLEKSMGFDGVMKLFHNLGSAIGEHSFENGSGSNNFGEAILTPEQANAKIKALKQDSEWTKRYLSGDVKAKSEMQRLHEMANPS
jgi:hypothetical protein